MKLYIKANDLKTVKNLDELLNPHFSKFEPLFSAQVHPSYKHYYYAIKEIITKQYYFYDKRELKKVIKGVYFGNSYCEHLLPTPLEIAKAYGYFNDKHHNFVFVFPPIGENKIAEAKEILEELKRLSIKEVVVNDFGMLQLVKDEFKTILGVNFTKVIKNAFLDSKEPFEVSSSQLINQKKLTSHLEFEIDFVREFYKSMGISRVSIENKDYDLSFLNKKPLFYVDIYYPNRIISHSRACDIAGVFNDKQTYFPAKNCQKFCTKASLSFEHSKVLNLFQDYNVIYKPLFRLELAEFVFKNKKNRVIWEIF